MIDSLKIKGLRSLCVREVQKSLKQSSKRLIEDKLQKLGLTALDGFRVFNEVIETPGDGLITFVGMQDHTADSIKSFEGVDRAWVAEASSITDRSMGLLRPTIRKANSELWFDWNPQRPSDAVDKMLRGDKLPTNTVVVNVNWSHNPWFPAVLDQERRDCLVNQPGLYPHIWQGQYATVLEGAYYAEQLARAELNGRITFCVREPMLKIYAIWDIGGTSRTSDATAIWIVQFVGGEVRVLDFYEVSGQPFEAHVNWLRCHDYASAVCVLPHDGVTHDTMYQVTPESYLRKAGFGVETVRNQGAGAAMKRIEAARQMFPAVSFNRDTTEAGRQALGWYHEKRRPDGFGVGPDHDWSSHAADAFGLIAVYRQTVSQARGAWDGKPLMRNLAGFR